MQKKSLIVILAVGGGLLLLGMGVWYLRSQASGDLSVVPVISGTPSLRTSTTSTASSPITSDQQKKTEEERAFLASLPIDTDGDGLSDTEEKKIGTDLNDSDSDNDDRSDAQEYIEKTDPLKADPPVVRGGVTRNSSASATILSPTSTLPVTTSSTTGEGSQVDADQDGLSDEEEDRRGTNLVKADTDGDELSDGDEVYRYKTDPRVADSDQDGYKDAEEIKKGYNPLGAGRCARVDCTL